MVKVSVLALMIFMAVYYVFDWAGMLGVVLTTLVAVKVVEKQLYTCERKPND